MNMYQPGGGAAEQLTQSRLHPAIILSCTSSSEQELQVSEQQDAGLQGFGSLERRLQLRLNGGGSVCAHGDTIHLLRERST